MVKVVKMYKRKCKYCDNIIITKCPKKYFCDDRCRNNFYYKTIPIYRKRRKANSRAYVKKHKAYYKKANKINFIKWYAKPENKEKFKMYYRTTKENALKLNRRIIEYGKSKVLCL